MGAFFDSRTFRACLFAVVVLLPVGLLLAWHAIGGHRPVHPEVERLAKALSGIWSNEEQAKENPNCDWISLEITLAFTDSGGDQWLSFRFYRGKWTEDWIRAFLHHDYRLTKAEDGVILRAYRYRDIPLSHRSLTLVGKDGGYVGSMKDLSGKWAYWELSEVRLKGAKMTLVMPGFREPYVFRRVRH